MAKNPKSSSDDCLTSKGIIEQFEYLYSLALLQDNISLAVRIKELQGRSIGLFQTATLPVITNLNKENLKKLINQLEESISP